MKILNMNSHIRAFGENLTGSGSYFTPIKENNIIGANIVIDDITR